ncbi:hypothetical protein GQR58_028263 [Nymphon striatum]|nr:hypothetical protein GQR58_028263 [Nymphon striatum]
MIRLGELLGPCPEATQECALIYINSGMHAIAELLTNSEMTNCYASTPGEKYNKCTFSKPRLSIFLPASVVAICAMFTYTSSQLLLPLLENSENETEIFSALMIFHIYEVELFPTQIRGIAVGCLAVALKLSSVLSSVIAQIVYLSYPAAAIFFIFIMTLIIPVVVFCLPETKTKHLSDTLEK